VSGGIAPVNPAGAAQARPLPLFPLRTVLFPGGQLPLKIFEARYLDMVSACLRLQQPFGVVCLIQGAEAGRTGGAVRFEEIGTIARIDEVDSPQPGILHLRCTGTQRFRLAGTPAQDRSGLWTAPVELIPDDGPVAPPQDLQPAVKALAEAAVQLASEGFSTFAAPMRLDEAGWVANRWCELLPISLPARQKLMELGDPLGRLRIVERLLRDRQVLDS